jgi:hypothetical protein
MALVLVLALISLTLGVSYALVRVQTSTVKTATNGRLTDAARQAALTGLSAGLRRISQTSWGGIGSTVTGNVNTTDTYGVTFTEGDPNLLDTDPDAADWPYRVTVTATGYAVDPTASGVTTTYKVEAVARLVPKQLSSNPSMWTMMLGYVYYQTGTDNNSVQLPVRITGTHQSAAALLVGPERHANQRLCRLPAVQRPDRHAHLGHEHDQSQFSDKQSGRDVVECCGRVDDQLEPSRHGHDVQTLRRRNVVHRADARLDDQQHDVSTQRQDQSRRPLLPQRRCCDR